MGKVSFPRLLPKDSTRIQGLAGKYKRDWAAQAGLRKEDVAECFLITLDFKTMYQRKR